MDEKQQIYYIPENYLNESRVFQGQFRLRYLIEGCVIAGIIGLTVWPFLSGLALQTRVTVMVVICAPFLLAGIAGFNGDPLSVAISSAYNWYKNRKLIVYNNTPRLLSQSPIEDTFGEDQMRDKIVDYIQKRQQEKIDRKLNRAMVEGETFEFEKDYDVDPFLRTDDGTEDRSAAPAKAENIEIYIDDDIDDLDVLDELYGADIDSDAADANADTAQKSTPDDGDAVAGADDREGGSAL